MNEPDPDIERDLRSALHAAADSVHPSEHLFASRATDHSPRRAMFGRWIAPASVAAAVVAIGVPVLVISARSGPGVATPASASPIVTVDAGFVTAAGVKFPLPAGWTADAVAQTPTSVTVCVARVPSKTCGGVTVRVAIPDAAGGITPVPDALMFEDPRRASTQAAPESTSEVAPQSGVTNSITTESSVPSTSEPSVDAMTGAWGNGDDGGTAAGGLTSSSSAGMWQQTSEAMPAKPDLADSLCPMLEDTNPVGGRPAQHLMIGSCTPGSPQAASWYVTDGSLSISTPRGVAAAQAAQIAAGVDFSGYGHVFGPQHAFLTSADPVPQTPAALSSSPASSATPRSTPAASSGATGESTSPAGTAAGSVEAPPAGYSTTATPAP